MKRYTVIMFPLVFGILLSACGCGNQNQAASISSNSENISSVVNNAIPTDSSKDSELSVPLTPSQIEQPSLSSDQTEMTSSRPVISLKKNYKIRVGERECIILHYAPKNLTNVKMTCKIEDETIAQLTYNKINQLEEAFPICIVTGLKPGVTGLTANLTSQEGNHSVSCRITVTE